MAGEGFDAGSIFVGFKAATKELEAGFQKAKAGIDNFGRGVQQAATRVETGGAAVVDSFTNIDRQTVTATARFARFTNRLIGVQFALAGVGNAAQGTFGTLDQPIKSVSAGLQTFAGIATVLPNPIGLAVGAIAGLTIALKGLLGPTEEEIKRAEDLDNRIKDLIKSSTELERQAQRAERRAEIIRRLGALAPGQNQLREDLNLQLTKLDQTTEKILNKQELLNALQAKESEIIKNQLPALLTKEEAIKRAAEINKAASNRPSGVEGFAGTPPDVTAEDLLRQNIEARAKVMESALDPVQRQIRTVRDEILQAESALVGTSDAARNLSVELESAGEASKVLSESSKAPFEEAEKIKASFKSTDILLNQGFITKAQALEQKIAALEQGVKSVADAFGKVEEETPDFTTALAKIKALKEELRGITGELTPNQQEFKKSFGEPFSQAVSLGIQEGILTGQSSMQTLAKVGENLFSNMFTQSVGGFQELMTKALTAIAGQGGGILGNLFTGVAGIAGLLLARRSGSSSQSFGNADLVDDSQQLRGVVAGPQSIAIASVGDNLRRAMVGVESRLDVLISLQRQIRNGSLGKPGDSGFSFAGSVPTS